MISTLLNKIRRRLARRSPKSFIKYLREQGIKIGEGTYFQNPKDTLVDVSRPSLVSIGENCFFNKDFTLLAHDWVCNVFRNMGLGFLNSTGKVSIGNNVSFGQNVMVLKGVTIGDNCFIGANSVVSKDIPSNSVAVGSPAKVIMSIEDYFQKRMPLAEQEAYEHARSISERFNRRPVPADFKEEFIWFVSGNEVENYPEIPIRFQLGRYYDTYVKTHKAKYSSFDEFLKAAGVEQ